MKSATVLLLVSFLTLWSCTFKHQANSETQTDLGAAGNESVAKTFRAYRESRTAHGGGCAQTGSGRKVMVTGFGLYLGADKNISGVVAEAMTSASFLPSTVDTSVPLARAPSASVPLGHAGSGDHGAKVWNRSVKINGKMVSLCVVVLDVLWDQAAAIIIHEASAFRPDVLIMSGFHGGPALRFEGGAQNLANSLNGYANSGAAVADNTPIDTFVLPKSTPGLTSPIAMTWNSTKLSDAARPLVSRVDSKISTLGLKDADPSNNYVCNNVSFVVMHALRGIHISLAGGQIELDPKALKMKAGFLHYPASGLDALDVARWTRVVAKVIETSLGS